MCPPLRHTLLNCAHPSQYVQIVLDTVEVVLRLTDKQAETGSHSSATGLLRARLASCDHSPCGTESLWHNAGASGVTAGGGWMGSFTSLFMQALFNTSISIRNIVVKYRAPDTLSTLTCGALKLYTAADSWQLAVKVMHHCGKYLAKKYYLCPRYDAHVYEARVNPHAA